MSAHRSADYRLTMAIAVGVAATGFASSISETVEDTMNIAVAIAAVGLLVFLVGRSVALSLAIEWECWLSRQQNRPAPIRRPVGALPPARPAPTLREQLDGHERARAVDGEAIDR